MLMVNLTIQLVQRTIPSEIDGVKDHVIIREEASLKEHVV